MKKDENVKKYYDLYVQSLERTDARRKLWNDQTKNRLKETLTSIKDSFGPGIGWAVQVIDNMTNYQTVNITMYTSHSGIFEIKTDLASGKTLSGKAYSKHGGYLAFCQSYNGTINIIIGYPYIDELVSQKDHEIVGTVEPEEITEDFISSKVVLFLQKMTSWEGAEKI